VSNPNNFLNSMILHDKLDLNDPTPVEELQALKFENTSK
jgi:hypothetical protein